MPLPAGFSRLNAFTGNCGATLAAGASCTIRVRFQPTAASGGAIAYNGAVTVNGTSFGVADAVTNSPAALTGTGVLAAVTLTPTNHDFGNVQLGLTVAGAPTSDFTLSNAGPGTFTITNGASIVSGAAFSRVGLFAGNCGGTVASGASCTIRVRFRPLSGTGGAIAYSGAVTVNGTAGGVADAVTNSPAALTGTGVQAVVAFSGPTPALNPASADRTVKSGTVTVSNTGNGSLTLTAAPTVVRTAGTGTFAITGGTCVNGAVVAAGGNCTADVQYTPPATGAVASAAHVTLADSGASTATQNSPGFTGN